MVQLFSLVNILPYFPFHRILTAHGIALVLIFFKCELRITLGTFSFCRPHRLQRDGETGEGDVYFDQPDHDGDPGFDKERAQGELDDDDVRESGDGIADEPPSCHETDDEVFLPGAVTEVDTRPRWLETEIY